MLICKPFARAADTTLHFIKNHQPIVAIAKLANSTHRFIRNRNNAAFALHGFKHDGTDTRRRGRQFFNHLDVACRHTDKVRQIRREVSAHVGVARCRERRNRTTVERMVKHNDLGLVEALEMPVFACKLDGGFIGFQAGIAEEATAQAAFFAELGGNLFLQDNAEIGDKAWALVNVSVATIKKEPRFAVAATTQALAGTPLRLLEFKTPFWRVQMPDGYIGWVHRLQIARMSAKELADWNASRRVVVTARFTTLTSENGATLAPLTAGSIVRFIEKQGNRVLVQLPDGHSGFLRTSDVRETNAHFSFCDRLRREEPRAFVRQLLGTAKQLLGTPYLWGGMSTNGVDCSGFVSLVWRLNGVILSRDADQQIAQAKQLDVLCVEDIPAGSLVAFGQKNEAGENVVRHIGIALENGDFIHSLGDVRIQSLSPNSPIYSAYFAERLLGAYTIDLNLQDVPNANTLSNNAFYRVE